MMIFQRASGCMRAGVWSSAWLLFCLLLLSPACKSPSANPEKKKPAPGSVVRAERIVLVVVDTLRADRMGLYGHRRNTTPSIDQVARESIVFNRFYAASPWTAPSFGTILTGVSPSVHKGGEVADVPEEGRKIKGFYLKKISSTVATVPEILSKRGFETAAVVSNPFLHPLLGYSRGFEHYDYTIKHRRAGEVTASAIEWLNNHGKSPFFLMVHYIDPHAPYKPLPDYRQEFFRGQAGRVGSEFSMSLREILDSGLTPQELERVKSLYDAEVKGVDASVANLFEAMKRQGLLENTWLVLTSDHGEEHMEHNGFFHGRQFEDEVTRMPLIMRAPGGKWGAGQEVDLLAGHRDLSPTILDLLGVPVPESMETKSMVSLIDGTENKNRPVYMEYPLMRKDGGSYLAQKHNRYAYLDGDHKIVKSVNGATSWVYDLAADPLEQVRMPRSKFPSFSALENRMEQFRSQLKRDTHRGSQGAQLPADVQKALENMGYFSP